MKRRRELLRCLEREWRRFFATDEKMVLTGCTNIEYHEIAK